MSICARIMRVVLLYERNNERNCQGRIVTIESYCYRYSHKNYSHAIDGKGRREKSEGAKREEKIENR